MMREMLLPLLIIPALASAHGDHDHEHDQASQNICEEALSVQKGEIIVRHDGLSSEYAAQALKDAVAARDVLNKLGVPTPPHQLIFAPERQLNILTATGVLPVPHAISGADIYKAVTSGRSLGVLEFAQPGGEPNSGFNGCSTCRSYYSNMTKSRDQRPIYFHVGGHNHVFLRSYLSRTRNIDPIAASEAFASEMETQYEHRGFEEVSLFFHYLHAVGGLQDYAEGTFASPAELTPEASEPVEVQAVNTSGNWSFLATAKKEKRYPWEKTPSVLQFMAANLPSHISAFKRELIAKYERTVRFYPAVVQQKFVHEGWATFLMMLGQKHSEWTSDRDIFDFSKLLEGVVGLQLKVDHPYSFGVHGFNHLYYKFKRQPRLKGLSELAVDIEFVKYVDQLIETMTDGDFINRVVDEEFVNRHNLALVRPGSEEEMVKIWRKLEQQGVPQEKWPRGIIISKSADRIRRHIGRRVGMKNSWPVMQAVNPKLANPFHLNQEQRNVENAPLEPQSAAMVFYAQAYVSETPVSSIFLLSERWLGQRSETPPGVVPVRMEVRPDGRVRLFKRNTLDTLAKNPEEVELPELAAQLEGAVEYYKTDQAFSFSDKVIEEDQKRWEQMFPRMISDEVAKANVKGLEGLVDYAPTAARAIILFSQMLKARFAKQMDAAFQGKLRLKFGPNGVKLPLIPMTPSLQYDREHIQAQKALAQPAPMDTISQRVTAFALQPDADDGSMIGPVPGGSVGDPVRIPPGGGGQGGKGQQPGDESEDGNEIEIPSELFRQLLAMNFEIPNPRMTDGETPMMRDLKMGQRRDSSEEPMWEKMVADALVKGMIARKAAGEKSDLKNNSPSALIREGFKHLDEEDYIIRSKREVPLPSFDAVVVINVDLSISMQGHRLDLVRNFVLNIRELFRAVYPDVKFHYVGFDTRAKEYSEKEIWSVFRGGGTAYAPPIEETERILSQYPYERWNQYVFFAGDSELSDREEFLSGFDRLRQQLQYFGLIITRDPSDQRGIDSGGLRSALEAKKQEWKWIGITQINDQNEIFQGLKELFPKTKK